MPDDDEMLAAEAKRQAELKKTLPKAGSAIVGALVAGAVGFGVAGPPGAAVGLVVGAVVGWFFGG